MQAILNIANDNELREFIKCCIVDEVKSIVRDEFREIVRNEIDKKLAALLDSNEFKNTIKWKMNKEIETLIANNLGRTVYGEYGRQEWIKNYINEMIKNYIVESFTKLNTTGI